MPLLIDQEDCRWLIEDQSTSTRENALLSLKFAEDYRYIYYCVNNLLFRPLCLLVPTLSASRNWHDIVSVQLRADADAHTYTQEKVAVISRAAALRRAA